MFSSDEIEELEDQYMIREVQKIGEGSYGKVYKAIDLNDNSLCAVKVISKQLIKDAYLEQSILQSINIPQIVKSKRLCENKYNIYMIMELMEGGSLKQYISQRKTDNKPITDVEASFIIKQILEAILYLHGKQIIHRDLKPENILIGKKNDISTIKIADFGLSFQFQTEGSSGRLLTQRCGTIIYMAPEQIGNQQYGKVENIQLYKVYQKPVDLWSCGLIMFLLLSMGNHPFYRSAADTKEKIIERIFNPQWELTESFSKFATDFFMKLTTQSQSERYKVGQALNHPWITRKFDDEIPLTFDQRRKVFENKFKMIHIVKIIQTIQYLKLISQTQKVEILNSNYKQTLQYGLNKAQTNSQILLPKYKAKSQRKQKQYYMRTNTSQKQSISNEGSRDSKNSQIKETKLGMQQMLQLKINSTSRQTSLTQLITFKLILIEILTQNLILLGCTILNQINSKNNTQKVNMYHQQTENQRVVIQPEASKLNFKSPSKRERDNEQVKVFFLASGQNRQLPPLNKKSEVLKKKANK